MRKKLSYMLVVILLSSLTISLVSCDDDDGGGPKPTPTPTPTPTPPPSAEVLSAVQISMGEEPTSCDDPIWDEAEEISVDTGTVDSGMLYGDGQLNMSGTFGGTTDFNRGQDANLRLTALYTTGSGEIFIRARWDDVIFNLDRRRALYNGPADPLKDDDPEGWTSQLNDDKIGLAFEIEPGTSSEFGTFDEVGCAAACHFVVGEGLDMRPATGEADIWHWKTSRSEPVAYVNDQFTNPVVGRKTDEGFPIESRNRAGGSNRGGPMLIWDGTEQIISFGPRTGETLDPAFILLDGHLLDVEAEGRDADNGEVIYVADCLVCHGVDGEGGIGPPLNTIEHGRESDEELDAEIADPAHPGAAAYNALSDADQADVRLRIFGFWGVPGYYLQEPSGSAADITTISDLDYSEAGIDSLNNIIVPQPPDVAEQSPLLNRYKWEQDGYCVILIRDLETGFDDDTQFDPSMTYPFGVALMDNDGKNHIGKTLLELEFLLP